MYMDGTTIFRFAILSCALFLVGNGWITVTTLNPEINAVMKGGKTRRRKNKIQ
jgi:hypothetical protein